jgi:hypothetical protein
MSKRKHSTIDTLQEEERRRRVKQKPNVSSSTPQEKQLTKEEALALVQKNGKHLQDLPIKYKQDKEIVQAAFAQDYTCLYFAHDTLKNDKEFMWKLRTMGNLYPIISWLGGSLRLNVDFITRLLQWFEEKDHNRPSVGLMLSAIDIRLRNDKDFLLMLQSRLKTPILNGVDKKFKDNRDFVLQMLRLNKDNFDKLSGDYTGDKEVMLMVAIDNPYRLRCASPALLDDKEFILEVIQKGEYNVDMCLVGNRLRRDSQVMLAAIKKNEAAIDYALPSLKNNRNFILNAIKHNHRVLIWLSDAHKNDRQMILECVQKKGTMLKYASQKLKHDKQMITLAYQHCKGIILDQFIEFVYFNDLCFEPVCDPFVEEERAFFIQLQFQDGIKKLPLVKQFYDVEIVH